MELISILSATSSCVIVSIAEYINPKEPLPIFSSI